jgi:Putative prokaryotic signal transducing protein
MADENDPVELYRAREADEAQALRAHLEAAGVPARVDGELLGGIAGEVPFGWVTAPRLLVPRGRLELAEAVLADFLDGTAKAAGATDGDQLCLACGAEMGDEPACGACGWSFYGEYGEPAE